MYNSRFWQDMGKTQDVNTVEKQRKPPDALALAGRL